MKSHTRHPQFVRLGSATILLALSLCAAPAGAACDPNNIKHMPCPVPASTHSSTVAQSYLGPKPAGSMSKPRHPTTYTAAKKPAIGPVAPGPTHATPSAAAASNTHGIIFVGGKPQNNKAALNPQPIPPGVPAKPVEHSH